MLKRENDHDSNDYEALSALINKRATLVSEVAQLRQQITARQAALYHVDACIRLLDPHNRNLNFSRKLAARHRGIKPTRLFGHGELGRLILDALRKAEGKPLAAAEIVTSVLEALGKPEDAREIVAPRVRNNLAHLTRRQAITSETRDGTRLWLLSSAPGIEL